MPSFAVHDVCVNWLISSCGLSAKQAGIPPKKNTSQYKAPSSTSGLRSKGFHVVSVQNLLTSLADDVAAAKCAIALQDGPVILDIPKRPGCLHECRRFVPEGNS